MVRLCRILPLTPGKAYNLAAHLNRGSLWRWGRKMSTKGTTQMCNPCKPNGKSFCLGRDHARSMAKRQVIHFLLSQAGGKWISVGWIHSGLICLLLRKDTVTIPISDQLGQCECTTLPGTHEHAQTLRSCACKADSATPRLSAASLFPSSPSLAPHSPLVPWDRWPVALPPAPRSTGAKTGFPGLQLWERKGQKLRGKPKRKNIYF